MAALKELPLLWQSLTRQLGVPDTQSENVWRVLVERYGENGRFYHTLTHLSQAFTVARLVRDHIEDWTTVQLAIWFHDVIYNPRSANNEEQSAAFARQYLQPWHLSPDIVQKVCGFIIATKSHNLIANDLDLALFLDIDLAILGAPPDQYQTYALAIRREYAFVPEITYNQARQQLLLSFLSRQTIYKTASMQDLFEMAARVNISREIESLASSETKED